MWQSLKHYNSPGATLRLLTIIYYNHKCTLHANNSKSSSRNLWRLSKQTLLFPIICRVFVHLPGFSASTSGWIEYKSISPCSAVCPDISTRNRCEWEENARAHWRSFTIACLPGETRVRVCPCGSPNALNELFFRVSPTGGTKRLAY